MSTGHDHAPQGTHRGKLAIAFGITATILVAELIGAWWTNSLALLVDAGHMLTDASGLLTFTSELAHGVSPATVAVQLATSVEAQAHLAPTFQSGVFVPDASGPSLVFDRDKCVLCLRCVRTCALLQGVHALGVAPAQRRGGPGRVRQHRRNRIAVPRRAARRAW